MPPNVFLKKENIYIVTKNDDTIYGKLIRVKDFVDPRKIIYKIRDSNGEKTIVNPAEIKLMRSLKGVDGDCTITTIYDEFFIKKIVDGRINVFQLIDSAIFFKSKDSREIKEASFGGFESRKKSHFEIRVVVLGDA